MYRYHIYICAYYCTLHIRQPRIFGSPTETVYLGIGQSENGDPNEDTTLILFLFFITAGRIVVFITNWEDQCSRQQLHVPLGHTPLEMHFNAYCNADIMIAGGSETCIDPIPMTGFCRLRAMSTNFNGIPALASRPFDSICDGFIMGEVKVPLFLY
jgi:hypothetical protein